MSQKYTQKNITRLLYYLNNNSSNFYPILLNEDSSSLQTLNILSLILYFLIKVCSNSIFPSLPYQIS